MTQQQLVTFEAHVAEQLAQRSADITQAWLQRLSAQSSSTELALQLADHMPAVLRQLASFIEDNNPLSFAANPATLERLNGLTRPGARDGRHPAAVLRAFDVLAQVLEEACLDWARSYATAPATASLVRVAARVSRMPLLLGEIARQTYGQEEHAPSEHLPSAREFADMAAHELNTPLNAAAITAQLLEYAEAGIHAAEARRLAALIRRNLARADEVLRDVRAAALNGERRWSARTLPFGQVLSEVLVELGDEQHTTGVRVEVEDSVPAIRIDAARVCIVLSNPLRNAIKYSDPARSSRWVRINFNRHTLTELEYVNSGVVDRHYFMSVYVREPNGVLFELATDAPGFEVAGELDSERLSLPPFLEPRRAEIEEKLRPLVSV